MKTSTLLLTIVLFAGLILFGCAGGGGGQQALNQQNQQATVSSAPAAGGAQGGASGGAQGKSTETRRGLNVQDVELKAFYDAALASEPEPRKTSLDALREAYAGQRVSKEDFIVFSLQAVFDPGAVPSAYSSGAGAAALSGYDSVNEVNLAIENWDSLSPAAQAKIKEWVFPSDEEEFAKTRSGASGAGGAGGASGGTASATVSPSIEASEEPSVEAIEEPTETPTVEPTEEPTIEPAGAPDSELFFAPAASRFIEIEAIPGKAEVFALLPAGASQADENALRAKMDFVKKGIVDSWDKFKTLLGGLEPTAKVSFKVGKVGGGTYGEARFFKYSFEPVKHCRATVDAALTASEDKTKSIAAHELFHCFQFYVPLLKWTDEGEIWLRESTATWSEHFVYPAANREHEYLSTFFWTRNKPLVALFATKEYSDYVFFLYLQQSSGSESEISRIVLGGKNGVKQAVAAIPDYENAFADYAVWNWNKPPVKNYADSPAFPDKSVFGAALRFNEIASQDVAGFFAAVDAGAAEYRVFEVPVGVAGSTVKKIAFKFSDDADAKHQRHALVKINGEWIEEDWTPLKEKRFCLTRPSEKVQAVVLVYSNSDLNAPFFGSYDVDSKGECPFEISGTTTIETTLNAPLSGGSFKLANKYVSRDVLQYDEGENAYKLKTRSLSCTLKSNIQGSGVDTYLGAPYLAALAAKGDCSGSATIDYADLASAPIRIQKHSGEGAQTFAFDLDPSINDARYFKYIRCGISNKMSWTGKGGEVALVQKGFEYSDVCLTSLNVPSKINWDEIPESEIQNGAFRKEETLTAQVEGGSVTTRTSVDYVLQEKP